ncbi:hypothetical protein ESCO_003252 [Escovopsis weberi]|uniref:Uncharacterized protein n=1 Tax=Escovopsis weberi TaxID=150374 RepID=A0A0M8N0R3_ESCWE|nr:hypothetical protein ESCO_003252 [Escovopsis weberi]
MATNAYKKPFQQAKKNQPPTVPRFIPEEAKKFITKGGRLLTTPENEAFLLEHGIEPDNGTMLRLPVKELGGTTAAAFSRRHVIAPYHLRFFDPRGHSLASAMRYKYKELSETTPLWVMTTVAGAASPVVRATAARKIKRSLRAALERLGYDELQGQGPGRQIRGTLWLTIMNPIAVLAMSEDRLGTSLARVLHEQHSSQTR